LGAGTLGSNTTGSDNIAIGNNVLSNNTGSENIALGVNALVNNSSGGANIAIGTFALDGNSTGSNNIALGASAGFGNTVGNNNIGIGFQALSNSNGRANRNIALGYQAGMNLGTGSNNMCIGNVGVSSDENATRIGNVRTTNTYIAGISGVTVAGGVGVVIDTTGHLGTVTSSARSKEAIRPMGDASDTILSLKPVTFRYKKELDSKASPSVRPCR